MMFTGIILACFIRLNEERCVVLGGQAFETKEECIYDLKVSGVPSVEERRLTIKGLDCYEWALGEQS